MSDEPQLAQIGFTSGLPPHILSELQSLIGRNEYSRGEVIFREGDACDDLHLVAAGTVALDMHVPARGNVRILTVGPGEMLGWSALLGNGRMTATATALEPVRTISLSGSALRGLCDRHPEAGYHLMQSTAAALARRLTATRLQLLDLFADPTRQRA